MVLNEIKQRLKDNLPCRVVSTQLIEAGVDIDFPLVLRAMAGLDAIAQAAGRCNREGGPDKGEVRVFYPQEHGMPSRGWLKETSTEALHVLRYINQDALSSEAMCSYFDRVYGLNDGTFQDKTDMKGIVKLLREKNANLEIPYAEIAERFKFIEDDMHAVVIPYDSEARRLLAELRMVDYPTQVIRQLQPYSVQLYSSELETMKHARLIEDIEGVYYVLDMTRYDKNVGLMQIGYKAETEVGLS
nr:hypothetical protein [Xylanibacillus composti]